METPLVSVIVSCYNHELYIRECLDGILMQQTDFPFEIIIGDDCSTDNSLTILREYEQKHPDIIKVIASKENLYSKKILLVYTQSYPKSRGKYIALCEGDDYWIDPHKLQRQVDFLESHPQYSMCFHDYMIKNGDKMYPHHYQLKKDCDVSISDLINFHVCQTATVVERRTVWESPEFWAYINDPNRSYGDINNYTACAESGKIRHLTGYWSIYRKHGESVTAHDEKDNLAEHKQIKGLKAIIRNYGNKYYFLSRNFRSMQYLERSSILIAQKKYFSGIFLKLVAFLLSPILVIKLYLRQYSTNCCTFDKN